MIQETLDDMCARSPVTSVSVIVIGRNEGQRLVGCLDSVLAIDYPSDRLELIYADSQSTDDSVKVARERGFTVVSAGRSASAARNAGARVASHDIIQFIDGDCIIEPGWIREAVRVLEDEEITCVHGRVTEIDPERSIYHRWIQHDWYFEPGLGRSCGGIAAFRRGALERVGGYDEELSQGEEQDLCLRLIRDLGAKILSVDVPMACHDIDMDSFAQYWRRCVRVGRGYAQISERYPELESWRRSCRSSLGHVTVALGSLAAGLVFWSAAPPLLWGACFSSLIVRNALRQRSRIGRFGDALVYSVHVYLAKLPIAIGVVEYWIESRWT